jgi:phage/plasmid-associated DNA primase
MKAFKKYTDEDDADNDQLLAKVKKQIAKFDSDRYHATLLKRSTGKLRNNQFVKILNAQPHLFPIRNGRKMDFRTLEMTDRTKEDYFTSNLLWSFSNKFLQIVRIENMYKRSLGYMMTGDTTAQVFFIWYGKGRNGKSVIANLMRAMMSDKFYHQCDKSIFVKTQKGHGASPEKVALIGKRGVVYSEGEIEFNFCSLKEITGQDMISARGLFANPKGPNQYQKDDDFVNKLTTEYLSEVFSWVAQGAYEYYQTKTIEMPSKSRNAQL